MCPGVLDVREQQLLERLGVAKVGESAASSTAGDSIATTDRGIRAAGFRRRDAKRLVCRRVAAVVLLAGTFVVTHEVGSLARIKYWNGWLKRLERPLVLVECGPDDHPLSAEQLIAHRKLCPSVQFVRLGGAQPVSEEIKHQALTAADIAVSLVDNPKRLFGGGRGNGCRVPLVVSDWNGYRDLVRDGMDGFRVSTRWASVAQQASVSLGWQQLGIESYPKLAGALGQLVQVDTQAAEAACLTLLTRSELRRAMGAAARQRALQDIPPHSGHVTD